MNVIKHLPLLLFIGLAYWGCEDKDEDCPVPDNLQVFLYVHYLCSSIHHYEQYVAQ